MIVAESLYSVAVAAATEVRADAVAEKLGNSKLNFISQKHPKQ